MKSRNKAPGSYCWEQRRTSEWIQQLHIKQVPPNLSKGKQLIKLFRIICHFFLTSQDVDSLLLTRFHAEREPESVSSLLSKTFKFISCFQLKGQLTLPSKTWTFLHISPDWASPQLLSYNIMVQAVRQCVRCVFPTSCLPRLPLLTCRSSAVLKEQLRPSLFAKSPATL